MRTLYTDVDGYLCEWMRNLIADKLLPSGDVLCEDVRKLQSAKLSDYTQVHLFAGIGGWGLSAKLAGWPDQFSLITASVPCQPFSRAGLRKGLSDERHLWPRTAELVASQKPFVVVGEQVWSDAAEDWWAQVHGDLTALGYRVSGSLVSAVDAGAPHGRPRIYWRALGNAHSNRLAAAIASHALHKQAVKPSAASLRAWKKFEIVQCPWDSAQRAVKPGIPMLVDGVPGRVDQLRAFGNAIIPQIGYATLTSVLQEIAEGAK